MRTQDEIIDRIKQVEDDDVFGWIRSDLVGFLDFEHAKLFLKNSATKEQWDEVYTEPTDENIRKKMADYLDFAFEKATNERGISASRSMDHYSAWIWLLDAEDHFGNVQEYHSYGIQHLYRIREYLVEKL